MADSQFSDALKERLRLERETRAKLIDDLASEIRRKPLEGPELARLFDGRMAAPSLERFYDEEEGCGCNERSQNALSAAAAALGRRDLREALYQTGRAIPELSDLSHLADRLTIAPGA